MRAKFIEPNFPDVHVVSNLDLYAVATLGVPDTNASVYGFVVRARQWGSIPIFDDFRLVRRVILTKVEQVS